MTDHQDFEISIATTPPNYDTNHVIWHHEGQTLGSGYQSKKDGWICILRCPICHRENYALNVTSGHCSWCGWAANGDERSRPDAP